MIVPPASGGNEPSSTSKEMARIRALRWFYDAELVQTAEAFEAQYRRLPQLLFQEVALASCPHPAPRILNVGMWQSGAVNALIERFGPDLVTIAADDDFPLHPASYDVVLDYSSLRLRAHPDLFLLNLFNCLAPNGIAYSADLLQDIPESLREDMLGRIDDPRQRAFFSDQLAAAFSFSEVKALIDACGFEKVRLSRGGIGGYPVESQAASALIANHPAILPLLFEMARTGFRTRTAADLVFHLFIIRDQGPGI